LGASIHQSPQTEGREPLVRADVTIASPSPASGLSPKDGYRVVSSVYDTEPNPMLSLEQRFLEQLLPAIKALDVVDLGCGTGRWLARLAGKSPRSLLGVDFSPEMLSQAKLRLGSSANLVLADCSDLPFPRSSADMIVCSFLASYLPDLAPFAQQIRRLLRPRGSIFLSDLHPATTAALGWRRGFHVNGSLVDIAAFSRPILEVLHSFEALGIEAESLIEPSFGDPEFDLFKGAGKLDAFNAATGLPAIYIAHLRLKHHRSDSRTAPLGNANLPIGAPETKPSAVLIQVRNASVALGPQESAEADLTIQLGRITSLKSTQAPSSHRPKSSKPSVDLTGFLLLPGLINAHDHLEFALFPRLGKSGYRNFVEWADDIHHPEASPVREHCAVPKDVRLWWGGIRNLLCGVTTVCHHNPYVEEAFDSNFAVRVQRDFSWAHSIHLDDDVAQKQKSAPPDQAFILHLAEGIDSKSAGEIFRLAEQGALTGRTVIVHGLGLDECGFSLLRSAGAALIWCPTSNVFLFGRTHDRKILATLPHLALGSDSPLTAAGDLLDEVRFAAESIGMPVEQLYSLVTTRAAQALRLNSGQGTLRIGGPADFIAVRDTGQSPARRLASLNYRDVELVVIGGHVQLASPELLTRLPRPTTTGLRPLEIEGEVRWIRAPLSRLFAEARKHLPGEIKLGGRKVRHGLPA
jgi:cytosine/adenosine deaminase-related metal-dependent hydrolase/SAM-dependent methyltransferase